LLRKTLLLYFAAVGTRRDQPTAPALGGVEGVVCPLCLKIG